jgi:hypothetical protein
MVRKAGFLTEIGKGNCGGTTGLIPGKAREVRDATSPARSTLITLQPGRVRSPDGYVPFNTPEPTDKPGHLIFALDIPIEAGVNGVTIDENDVVRRIVINKSQDKGAQITIEEYVSYMCRSDVVSDACCQIPCYPLCGICSTPDRQM